MTSRVARVLRSFSTAVQPSIAFVSDNVSGVDDRIMRALFDANVPRHSSPYGRDAFTLRAEEAFKRAFDNNDIDVHFVYGGTAANVVALASLLPSSIHAVVCATSSHLYMHECGAPEKFLGCQIFAIQPPARDGKLTPEAIDRVTFGVGDQHVSQPSVVSIADSTEYGCVYSRVELRALRDYCDARRLLLHVDGARFSNAAVSKQLSLADAAEHADALSFGGTKNGCMFGEAIVLFKDRIARHWGNEAHVPHFKYLRKQAMQLHSKSRFLGAQFAAYVEQGVWSSNARHANAMAALLSERLTATDISSVVRVTRPVQANAVFVEFPDQRIVQRVGAEFVLDVWEPPSPEIRLMTSFVTTENDVERFVAAIRRAR